MPNVLYPRAKQAFLAGKLDVRRPLKAILIDTTKYTYNPNHAFLSSIPSGSRVSVAPLQNTSVLGGTLQADDTIFDSVEGETVGALIIYRDARTMYHSRLVAYMDGFEKTPNGEDIKVAWPERKVFSI